MNGDRPSTVVIPSHRLLWQVAVADHLVQPQIKSTLLIPGASNCMEAMSRAIRSEGYTNLKAQCPNLEIAMVSFVGVLEQYCRTFALDGNAQKSRSHRRHCFLIHFVFSTSDRIIGVDRLILVQQKSPDPKSPAVQDCHVLANATVWRNWFHSFGISSRSKSYLITSLHQFKRPDATPNAVFETHPHRQDGARSNYFCKVTDGFSAGADEFRRTLRHNCIAVAPQQSHAAGNPMSQRECAGFNAPRFSIGAGDEFVSRPRI